jgi:hypothetical protein
MTRRKNDVIGWLSYFFTTTTNYKMNQVLMLFQNASNLYGQGKLHCARTEFVAALAGFISFKSESFGNREGVEQALKSYHIKKQVNGSDLFGGTMALPVLNIDHEHNRCVASDFPFVHLPLDEQNETTSASSIGVFDGIIPPGSNLIRSLEALGAVLIYNLAVVTHVIGLMDSENAILFIVDKAFSLYEQTQSLLVVWYSLPSISDDIDILTVLNAALIGNMSQICRDYYRNSVAANQLIQSLERIVMKWEEEIISNDKRGTESYLGHFASQVQLSHFFNVQPAPSA